MARRDLSEAAASFPAPVRLDPGAPPPLVESYRRLAEVFHDVLSEQSLDSLLERIADTLADLIPYDALHVYQVDEAGHVLVPVVARSEWADEVLRNRIPFGQGVTGWAVANLRPVLANRAHLDPRVAIVPGTPAEPEALISVPLIARGSLKGALNVYRLGEDAAFAPDEFELAKWFGDAAALALDNAQVRERLERQAQSDSLTGLYNHRFFHERLRAELTRAGRARDSVAVLMFDIDDFKRVNDICGHAVGDQILVAIADLLRALVRGSDAACRLGGEEFAVILPSCDAGDALGLARRLMERLEERPIDAAGEVTLSVGIAEGPRHGMNPRELVACAETAMMTAKVRGKNRIVLFNELTSERPRYYEHGRDVRSIAHLKMLQSLAGKLNRLSDVRELAEAILAELRGLIDYHDCRVYLVEGDAVVPVACGGKLEAEEEESIHALRLQVGQGITGHVAATGRSLLIANALESEHYFEIPGTDPIDESVIAVPLRYRSRVTGVVFLSKLGTDQFDADDLRLLEVLAGHVSVALENARLYETVRREAENAKAWLEFADAMSSAGSFEAIADETVRTVARLLEIGQCSLWLHDARAGEFYCAASFGYVEDPEAAAITQARIAAEAAEEFIEARKTPFVLTAAELRDHFFASLDLVLRAIATAPLDPGYGVRGWISIRKADDDVSHFTEDRLRLLDGLAYRASMALQKALLYREQQESAEAASAMLEFARALAAADEREDMLERIVELSGRILGSPETHVWLEDPASGELRVEAMWGVDEAGRERVRALWLSPELPSGLAAVAFRIDEGRRGYLVAAEPHGADGFDELKLRMLWGLADQAKLAISTPR